MSENEKPKSLFEKFMKKTLERKKRIKNGEINCVPNPHKVFSKFYPGLEKERMIIVSAPSKCSKSQFTLSFFIINTLLYWSENRSKINPVIYYFNLEESEDVIVNKIICNLMYYMSNGEIDIDPNEINSVNKELDDRIVSYLEDPAFAIIAENILSRIEFVDERNRIGICNVLKNHALNNGHSEYEECVKKDKDGNITSKYKKFVSYIPNDEKEHVIAVIDHVSLISKTSMDATQRESMSALASDLIDIRNKYRYSIIVVQQQGNDVQSNEAIKMNRITSQFSSLSDSKDFGKGCDMMIGLTNPSLTNQSTFAGYDISKLRNNFRSVEVVVNRHGDSGQSIGMFFSGKNCFFKELPNPNSDKMKEFYNILEESRSTGKKIKFNFNLIKKKHDVIDVYIY